MRPKRPTASSMIRCGTCGSARSPTTACASEPAASTSRTVPAPASSPRAETTTLAPRWATVRAIARARPYEPTTTTTCSDSGFFRAMCPDLSRLGAVKTRYPGAMPGWIGFPELLVLLLVILLVFGPKRLPEMGRSLGRGMREFKDSVTGRDRDDRAELPVGTQDTTAPAPPRDD